jgi:hypothetical protein
MKPDNTLARVTGVFYVLMAITSGFGLKTMEGFVAGRTTAEALARIEGGRPLYELSIASNGVSAVVYLVLALLLYRLLRSIDEIAASLVLAFVAVSIPVMLVATAQQLQILSLIDGVQFGMTNRARAVLGAAPLTGEQLQTQAALALYAYDNLIVVCCLFWGLWLMPLGWLMWRADGIAPKTIGVLLLLGGIGYALSFFRPVLFPDFKNPLFEQFRFYVLLLPLFACEFAMMLWLLIMGAPKRRPGLVPAIA